MNRTIVRAQLFMWRRQCEWPGCAKRATDMHEVIPRNATEGNETARDLSFQPEIVSMLCHEHHMEAHNGGKTARSTLLRVNTATYGKNRVLGALRAVMDASCHDISYLLEEEWTDE